MKKTIYLFISFLFISLNLAAQITVTRTDFPSRGDVFFILEDDDMSGLTAGATGSQTWNYTSLDVTNLDTILFVEPSQTPPYQTPFDTLFPNSNLALSGEIGGVYLKISTDSLMLDGIAADLLSQGFVTPVDINPDLKLVAFPANYQDNFTSVGVVDTTIDTNILGGIVDKIRAIRTQTNTVNFDAYGTLNLPNGSFQTLRMFTKEITLTEVYLRNAITGWPANPNQVLEDTVYRYNWIAKNEGYYVMEAEADKNGNLISGFFKTGAQVFAYTSQQNDPSCYEDCDGSATITGVGGTGSYSYAWSANAGGGTGNSVSGLCAGDYYYTITDNVNSSTYTDTVTIQDPDSISISVALTKESPLGNDGEIDLNVSGGTPPYNYSWTGTTQGTQDVNSLAGGNYTVTVTDANNCTKDTTIILGTRVGINDITGSSSLKLYPQPANEVLYVESDLKIESLRLIDVLGKSVYSGRSQQINTAEFDNGIYLLEVNYPSGASKVQRLVISH